MEFQFKKQFMYETVSDTIEADSLEEALKQLDDVEWTQVDSAMEIKTEYCIDDLDWYDLEE